MKKAKVIISILIVLVFVRAVLYLNLKKPNNEYLIDIMSKTSPYKELGSEKINEYVKNIKFAPDNSRLDPNVFPSDDTPVESKCNDGKSFKITTPPGFVIHAEFSDGRSMQMYAIDNSGGIFSNKARDTFIVFDYSSSVVDKYTETYTNCRNADNNSAE